MRTFFSVVALIILGGIARMIMPLVLTILSLPGKLIALPNASGWCGKPRFVFATIVTTLSQSYVYLAYTAFVVSWTMLAVRKERVGFVVFFAALFAVFFPVGAALKDAKINTEEVKSLFRGRWGVCAQNKANAREGRSNMAFQAVSATFILTMAGCIVFAFFPKVAEIIFNWIPFINTSY